jgi:hypothetical protein
MVNKNACALNLVKGASSFSSHPRIVDCANEPHPLGQEGWNMESGAEKGLLRVLGVGQQRQPSNVW